MVKFAKILNIIKINNGDWGLGIGDWGLGIGDWVKKKLRKNDNKKKIEKDVAVSIKLGEFIKNPKYLSNFLEHFTIRELIAIMKINKNFFNSITNSDIYKKYLLVRNNFLETRKEDDVKNPIKNPLQIHIDYEKYPLSYYIYNNCQNIKKYNKLYSLTNTESHIIFNGIMEYLIIKEKGEPSNNTQEMTFSVQDSRALNGLNNYLESIYNLSYSTIIILNLNNVGIAAVSAAKLLCNILIRYSKTLKILNLSNNCLNDKLWNIIFTSLDNKYILEILNLSYNNIENFGLSLAKNFFNGNTCLKSLILNHNLLGEKGSNNLFKFLSKYQNLNIKAIDISYNGLTKNGTKYISSFVQKNENLISLNVSGNYIGDEGIRSISDAFPENEHTSKLTYIDLQNNNISQKGCQLICNIINHSDYLNGLYINNNPLTSEAVYKIFFQISSKNSYITTLDISNTQSDDKVLKEISDKVNNNLILEKLIISNNNFKKGEEYLKNLLAKESNLKYINISYCQLNKFSLIFQGLAENKNIRMIDFSGNKISSKKESQKALENAIEVNNILEKLILDDCGIDDETMKFLSKGLTSNHSLRKISLNLNKISSKSIPDLVVGAQKSRIIKVINLDDNPNVSDDDIEEVEIALESNINYILPVKRKDEKKLTF